MPLVIRTTGFDEYLDPDGEARIKALILGGTGVGKTPFAAEWPKPIFAAAEKGLMSVARKKVPYAHITGEPDMLALVNHLRQDSLKKSANRKYGTLVVDTFDAYQRTLIQQRLRMEKKESLSGWADWGWLDGKMQTFADAITNLNMNVVVLLHTKDLTEGEGDDRSIVKAARLKGDIKDSVFQDFDLIGLLETSYEAVEGERVLTRHIRWQPEPKFPFIRDRSFSLPRFTDVKFEENDFTQIWTAITESVDGIPESTDVDTLETEDDGEITTDAVGGPVNANIPAPAKKAAAKAAAPAKSAAAKKAAAAKTDAKPAAAKPDPGQEALPEAEVPDGLKTAEERAADAAGAGAGDAPISEPTTPVADTKADEAAPAPDADQAAVDAAKDGLGAEVETQEPAASVDPNQDPEKVCGFQPITHKTFDPLWTGCGRDISGEPPAKINLSLLRAKVKLCGSCFQEFRDDVDAKQTV